MGPLNEKCFHLILKHWPLGLALSQIDFNTTQLWVQAHGLPLEFMTKKNATIIGGIIGKFLQVDIS
jgi:hypothetical protein